MRTIRKQYEEVHGAGRRIREETKYAKGGRTGTGREGGKCNHEN